MFYLPTTMHLAYSYRRDGKFVAFAKVLNAEECYAVSKSECAPLKFVTKVLTPLQTLVSNDLHYH